MHLTQAQLFYFNGDKHEAYRHLKLYLDAWPLAWPNASSVVTLASNGSDTGLFLLVARAAWSHHIVAGSTKR